MQVTLEEVNELVESLLVDLPPRCAEASQARSKDYGNLSSFTSQASSSKELLPGATHRYGCTRPLWCTTNYPM